LSEWANVIYKATAYYAPEWDRTIKWDDPAIGIKWPIREDFPLHVSEKDARGILLENAEIFP
jgi:dTDP-4-dehydrorhamnose 3,5-epimerase